VGVHSKPELVLRFKTDPDSQNAPAWERKAFEFLTTETEIDLDSSVIQSAEIGFRGYGRRGDCPNCRVAHDRILAVRKEEEEKAEARREARLKKPKKEAK
jgi:hypothetical protein